MYGNKQEDVKQKMAMAARMTAIKFFITVHRADIAKINLLTFKIKFPDSLSRRDQDYVEAVSTEVKMYIARVQRECAQEAAVEEKTAIVSSPPLNSPILRCLSPSCLVGPASPCAMPLNAPSHRLMSTLAAPVLNEEPSVVLGIAFRFLSASTTMVP